MKFFVTDIYFDSIFRTQYESSGHGSYGSGYCKEQNKYNRMIARIKLFGITIYKGVVEYELIPSHVWISTGCFGGDDSGWCSKWKDHPNFNRRLS